MGECELRAGLFSLSRSAVRALALGVAAILQGLAATPLGQAQAASLQRFGPGTELVAATPQSQPLHFKLLGPDWAKVPKGYRGVLPEKIVAELNIPAEYVAHSSNLLGKQVSAKAVEEIPIAFSYPSMTGVAEDQNFATRVDAIIRSGSEEYFREGTHSIILGNGNTREPSLDVNGLCGYVNRIHPGYAGVELYTACKEPDQTFSIICNPSINSRRVCIADDFLADHIAGQLIYQYAILKDHLSVLRAVKALVMPFAKTRPEK